MEIEWDPSKARTNLAKHGVSFSDVEPAFYDEFALSIPDQYSEAEERFLLVGRDALGRVVTVCYTYRTDAIRIISARPATKSERREYEKELRF
jgi:uncharacterized DUF497 family protein